MISRAGCCPLLFNCYGSDPEAKTLQEEELSETTDWQEVEQPEPCSYAGEVLSLGDRGIRKIDLDQYDIKCGYGRVGAAQGSGSFGTVSDFYLENPDGYCPLTADQACWVFKPELPLEQSVFKKRVRRSSHFPLTEKGWLHSTLRSVLCYQIACRLKIDNFVETHIGFSGQAHGTLMRKIEGETLNHWLEKKGYFQKVGEQQGLSEERARELVCSRREEDMVERRQFLEAVLKLAFEEHDLLDDWQKILCVDFLTGQSDRQKLSNMMVANDKSGRLRLIAIDNDLAFPATNPDYMALTVPPTQASGLIDSSFDFTSLEQMVHVLLAETTEPDDIENTTGIVAAFHKRIQIAKNEWFRADSNEQEALYIGPMDVNRAMSFGSGSGSGRNDDADPESAYNVCTFTADEIAAANRWRNIKQEPPRSLRERLCVIQ